VHREPFAAAEVADDRVAGIGRQQLASRTEAPSLPSISTMLCAGAESSTA
jgi:hypothetical protein